MIPTITKEQIQKAIQSFLTAQYNKKTEKEQKQLAKAIEDNDVVKIAELNEFLAPFKEKYCPENWLKEAKIMAENLKVGTHISKGIHPSSRGDNVNFTKAVYHHFVGTHTLKNSVYLDANSPRGAIDLPLVSFFEWEVIENSGIKLRDVILKNDDVIKSCFADDFNLSCEYQQVFFNCLNNQLTNANTHERNKQILYPLTNADGDNYHVLVALYPSVLTHEVFHKINVRYSDDNKAARDNRHKKTAIQAPYISFVDLAVVQLGGTKPQNVSQLMSKQGGRNYLLPSLPPRFKESEGIRISKNSKSIFNSKSLYYKVRNHFKQLFNIVKDQKNTVDIRDSRKVILDEIIYEIFTIATHIQNTYPAGWSNDYNNLSMSEKYWLDPKRAELEDELDFKEGRETKNWQIDIQTSFADWMQSVFQDEFKNNKHHFADPEHHEWQSEMKEAIKESIRLGQGVFA